ASTFINDGTFTKSGSTGVGALVFNPFINNGMVNVTSGTLSLGGGSSLTPGLVDVQAVTLGGSGTINADVANSGTVAPGQSPGTLTINGDYTQRSNGALNIEIAGPANAQFDRVLTSGTASLGGTLHVLRDPGFFPGNSTVFSVVVAGTRTGTFG